MGYINGRKLVLDLENDRAAISLMHAYIAVRGVDLDGQSHPEGVSIGNWLADIAQELADNPDTGLRTACGSGEGLTSPVVTHSEIAAVLCKESLKQRERVA